MKPEYLVKLREWFEANGRVHDTSTGVWIGGVYLDQLAEMLYKEVQLAEKRGERRGRRGKK